MKKQIYPHLFVFFLVLLSFQASAQQTGSFETNITFQGNPRQLALYVPADYDSTKRYSLMVCLHGLGDTAVNYKSISITLPLNTLRGTFARMA
ncbi:MAG TPA: hypothetical protein VEC12_00565 [Bacteroidia bacterium]|nr:hypothetical protein [Bacteroidia bacterium]